MSDPFFHRSEAGYEALYRRYMELRRELDHLSTLREIALAVNASLEMSEALPIIANVVQGALEFRRMTIYTPEPDGQTVKPLVAKYGNDLISTDRLEGERAAIAGTPFAQALSTRQVVLIDGQYQQRAYVPLVAKGDLLGVMLLEDRLDGEPFSKHDAGLFQQIAVQIAMALHNAQLYAMAVTDGLTGLFVRRYFDLRMSEEFNKARRYGRPFALLLFDIDHFKKFNDTHGHQTGDLVLKQFARLLQDNTRAPDVCCRYGGEEMAVILPETKLDDASAQANRLCRTVCNFAFSGQEGQSLHVTTSIGVAAYRGEFNEPPDMVKAVDTALYQAKERGRNRVVVDGPRGLTDA